MNKRQGKNPAHASRMRKRWQDPEFRARMLAAQSAHIDSRTEAHRRKVCAAAGLDEITDQQYEDYRVCMSNKFTMSDAIATVFGK